jgi:hypothetical protein
VSILRIGAFSLVFQRLASHSIDTYFTLRRASFHVEGITQAATSAFMFQFLFHDLAAWMRIQDNLTSLLRAQFGALRGS